jgi:cysteine desulfurase/selenocysteine lyase
MNQLDINKIREEFPILSRQIYKRPLVYLDNTATSQTPRRVVDSLVEMYYTTHANVHRGVHRLSLDATEMLEKTRSRVAKHINAAETCEIVFTRGTTESINLVASSLCQSLKAGDEIVLTDMEHHSNIVPWQLAARRHGLVIKHVGIDSLGALNMDQLRSALSDRTRVVSVCHVSNVLGTVNPVKEIVRLAHERGAYAVIDGAQAAPHYHIDVQDIDADFYAFSAHKMYGPTGVGVLYGRRRLLEELEPYQGGGEMIGHVSWEDTTFADLPYKFEAGTPDFTAIAAFDKAFDFIDEIGIDNIAAHEHHLLHMATDMITSRIHGVRIFGTTPDKCAVLSFLLDGAHHYDTGTLLDRLGVAVRTGHHCAQPLMHALGIEGTVRASFAVYNTEAEVETFVNALERVAKMLKCQ